MKQKATPREAIRRSGGFAPILIILLIAILGVVGYLGYKNYQLKIQVSPIPTVSFTPSLTPKPTLDPTMSWISFTSSKYKYSLKFPNTLFKFNQGNNDDLWVSTTNDALAEENVGLSVGMVSGPDFNSLDKYISSNPLLSNNSTKVNVKIDGISGYKIRHAGMGGAERTYAFFVIEGLVFKNGVVYSLSMDSKSEDLINKYSSIFDQILSTFKFIN